MGKRQTRRGDQAPCLGIIMPNVGADAPQPKSNPKLVGKFPLALPFVKTSLLSVRETGDFFREKGCMLAIKSFPIERLAKNNANKWK
jgi:hypothetical protein